MPLGHCITMTLAQAGKECSMVATPSAPDKLKAHTWYYAVDCACSRLHALCEDLFVGKGDEQSSTWIAPIQSKSQANAVR